MSMLPQNNPVGVFSATHLIYMSFWFALITIVAIIIYRKKLSEKQQDKINRILAVVILIVMLAYRICVPVGYILIDHNEAYNW